MAVEAGVEGREWGGEASGQDAVTLKPKGLPSGPLRPSTSPPALLPTAQGCRSLLFMLTRSLSLSLSLCHVNKNLS